MDIHVDANIEQLKIELAKAAEQLANIKDKIAKGGMGAVGAALVAMRQRQQQQALQAASEQGESVDDILRHDAGHDNWHAMHGDPPCKSEADCASMRAKYKDEDTTTKSKKNSKKPKSANVGIATASDPEGTDDNDDD